jgi:hypothetical protein
MEQKVTHCAVYTRKSCEDGLGQEFNSPRRLNSCRRETTSPARCMKTGDSFLSITTTADFPAAIWTDLVERVAAGHRSGLHRHGCGLQNRSTIEVIVRLFEDNRAFRKA